MEYKIFRIKYSVPEKQYVFKLKQCCVYSSSKTVQYQDIDGVLLDGDLVSRVPPR